MLKAYHFFTRFYVCLLLGILLIFALQTCKDKPQSQELSVDKPQFSHPSAQKTIQEPDSLISKTIGGHQVDIVNLRQDSPLSLLILPGWNFSRRDWCENSSLCQRATEEGYTLILPEMAKSIYARKLYPQTRDDWRVYPTLAWVTDTLIPHLQQEYKILLETQKNFIIGLSTGGRGVAMIALARPKLFTALAALSGDFDQTQMPSDRLMIGYYGSYQSYPQRWEGEDNPTKQATQWQSPIYLGHGTQDQVVPYQQTQIFYEAIKGQLSDSLIQLELVPAKHDYAYWDSQVNPALAFFKKFLK